jgi:STE24 endopeptidase
MNNLFVFFIVILTLEFIFDRWLDAINSRSWRPELPEGADDIYDKQRYALSRDYSLANYRFGKITATFSFVVMFAMLWFHGFAWLDNLVKKYTPDPVWQALLFFGILGLASDLLSLPFSVYRTFVIEEKFGFNKTTARTFILDKIKGYLLAGLMGGGLLALVVVIYTRTGSLFWLWTWFVVSAFLILMNMFYTAIILPLFNKLTPLEGGELKENIEAYCSRNGFILKNIFVMDGSKRSSKANAFFSGLGHRKTIVLFDTLVNNYSSAELTAVLAHEVGHYKLKHTVKGTVFAVVNTGLVLFVLSLCLGSPSLAAALGASGPSFHIGLLAFGILYSPLSEATGIFMNYLSRKHEFEADHFARETYNGAPLAMALRKLTSDNLGNLTPHPFYVKVHYSHPPVLQRLEALEK